MWLKGSNSWLKGSHYDKHQPGRSMLGLICFSSISLRHKNLSGSRCWIKICLNLFKSSRYCLCVDQKCVRPRSSHEIKSEICCAVLWAFLTTFFLLLPLDHEWLEWLWKVFSLVVVASSGRLLSFVFFLIIFPSLRRNSITSCLSHLMLVFFSAKRTSRQNCEDEERIGVECVTEQITAIEGGSESENFYDFLPTMQNFKCFSLRNRFSGFLSSLHSLGDYHRMLNSVFVILARKSY